MAQPDSDVCEYCRKEIPGGATVCHHCSHYRATFRNWVKISDVIAILAIGFAAVQLFEAFQANTKAQEALRRANEVECAVLNLAQSVIAIAEVIPRTTAAAAFQGGSLSQEDRTLLKTEQARINEIKKSRNVKCP
jgi:hypothetical protein